MTYIASPLAGLGRGISWRPPAYSLLYFFWRDDKSECSEGELCVYYVKLVQSIHFIIARQHAVLSEPNVLPFLSICLSVCLSIQCQCVKMNGLIVTLFDNWYGHHFSFSSPTAFRKFEVEPPSLGV